MNRYYGETLFSRLDNKSSGVIIVVMQRLHDEDLAGFLLNHGGWVHLNLPAIANTNVSIPIGQSQVHHRKQGEILHPAREPLEVLDEIKRNIGSFGFQAQYQQAPIPNTGNMIKREWLREFDAAPDRDGAQVVQSWDTALKGDQVNDFSVCTTWINKDGIHYLVGVFRKQCDYPSLVPAAVQLYNRYKPDAVLIEDHGSGTALIQDLQAHHGIHAIPRRASGDKITRLSIVSPAFEAGQVHLPREAAWLPEFFRELLGFPQTRHDDQVDSVSQYLGWARERSTTYFKVDWM